MTSYIPRKLRPLMGKALSSIADQGTSSGTNFAVNILLARWLTRSDYGAFSVSWSVCVIFVAFHNALILEPMTVVGPAEYGAVLPGYLKTVSTLNWYVVLALGLLAGTTGLFYRQQDVRYALAALCLCLPGYLLLLTKRREQYVLNRPILAFRISLVYACVVGGLLAALHALGRMSALTGLLCIGAALPVFILAGMWQRQGTCRQERVIGASVGAITHAHWTYGKWLLASSVLAVGIADVQTILLSVMVDLKSAGALRALMNFTLPLSQLLTVLSVYALPSLARQMKRYGAGRGLRQTIVFPVILLAMSAAYVFFLMAFAPTLERILYNGRMAQYIVYVPALALAAFLSAIGASFSTLLRAAQNSQHQLFAGVTATVVGVSAALLLLKRFGLGGAIFSIILANTASSICIAGTYLRMVRRDQASWAHAFHYFRNESEERPQPVVRTE